MALWGPDPIGGRRLRSLIVGLSPDTALRRASDPHTWMWGYNEELLAVIAELVDVTNRNFHAAHSKPGGQPPQPIKINRPGRKKRKATAADLRAMFGSGSIRVDGR